MKQYDLEMLLETIPFSFVPEKVMKELFGHFTIKEHKKGTTLFIQGESKVDNFYIILKGSLERYFEGSKGKILKDKLGEGDTYGGMSILMNDSISVIGQDI